MKSVCSIHEQAYDVGERCPYCEAPAIEPITFTAPPGWSYAKRISAYELVLADGLFTGAEILPVIFGGDL